MTATVRCKGIVRDLFQYPDRVSSMTKTLMYTYDALLSDPIKDRGPISAAFLRLRIHDFRSAGQYVRDLSFGRNAATSDLLAVLNEGKGTCSTKHALLKALASQQGLPIRLVLGIYEMNARNTPGIGHVLEQHHLPLFWMRWFITINTSSSSASDSVPSGSGYAGNLSLQHDRPSLSGLPSSQS